MKRLIIVSVSILLGIFLIGACSPNGDDGKDPEPSVTDTKAPQVFGTYPDDLDTDVAINRYPAVTFNEDMRSDTLTTESFTLVNGENSVTGTVEYSGRMATFVTTTNLEINTLYTATISTHVKDLAGNSLVAEKKWSFTTGSMLAAGPDPVNLGTAENFTILAKSAIATVPLSVITGTIGVSPAAASYITGFSLVMDPSNTFSTSPQITGKVYAANYVSPSPQNMTTAIGDMENAYIDAAGRTNADYIELGAGDISGLTLVPGLYKWGTALLITSDVILKGRSNDVWIFQVAGDVTVNSGVKMILEDGAKPENIFWQSFGAIVFNTTAHGEGVYLSSTGISLATGASVNGRLLSQTAVTLDKSVVNEPIE